MDNESGHSEFNQKEFLEYIVRTIVDKPEEVQVTEIDSERTIVYELRVSKSDMGIVIGRRGQHAQAIRTLLNATAGRRRKRIILEIVE